MGRKPKEQPVEEIVSFVNHSSNKLNKFLAENRDHHFSGLPEIDYRVSLGSLKLDIETNGGLGPGLHRFCGITEGGKTSEALEVMGNFLLMPNAKGLYVKAEGRLSKEVRERSKVKFVFTPEEWVIGTCFVLECNIFETVFDLLQDQIRDNPENNRYGFIIDSVDGLQLKEDSIKTFDEANKVSGGALLSATFMKKIGLAMGKFGHLCILISQVRSEIVIDPYAKKAVKLTSASGGNALMHNANFIFEFETHHYQDSLIKKNPKERPDAVKNPILGHWAKITIKKSPNEKTNLSFTYPIRYGRKNGTSIWVELEVAALLIEWGLVVKKASWLMFSDSFRTELAEAGITPPEQFQGEDKLQLLLEKDKTLCQFCIDKFKRSLTESGDEAV